MASDGKIDKGGHVWTVASLPRRADAQFDIIPSAPDCASLADELGVDEIRKLRFHGVLRADGARDWRLDGHLGVTVVQPCVATLAPVTTRLDEPVTRRFVAEPSKEPLPGSETELTADETEEPLGAEIDLMAVLAEALALALPAYPRADGAGLVQAVFSGPGIAPMTDDEAHPFAALSGLKARLTDKD